MGVPRVNSARLTSEIQQCEVCACWTRDGSFVGAEEQHFICRWCKRDAAKNWFIRFVVERWKGRNRD